MDDEQPRDDAARPDPTGETPAPAPAPRPPRKRQWGVTLFGLFVILPILLVALWTTIALSWSYSKGERAGYVQKFSQKGWLCKTWEGEISMVNVPSQPQEKFAFSVRNDSIAHEITRRMGNRVSITYEQHPGIPLRCFGDTEYFVTAVRAVPGAPPLPPE